MIRATETTSGRGTQTFGEHTVAVWYLISRADNNGLEVLTVFPRGGQETVPVFGTAQVAREFLHGGGFEPGWRVRESTAGELISLLLSRLACVNNVALDPLPDFAIMGSAHPQGRTKREFIALLMGRPLLVPVR